MSRTGSALRKKETIIPTVKERPVNSLGKWYRAVLNNKQSVKEMFSQPDIWMTSLEKRGLGLGLPTWGTS